MSYAVMHNRWLCTELSMQQSAVHFWGKYGVEVLSNPRRMSSVSDISVELAHYDAEESKGYMNDGQKNHFRALLLAWKQDLVEESRRTLNSLQDEPLNLPDPNDRASQEEEFSIALRARDRERKLLHKIDKALARLASDDYGYCEACGVEIGLRRLEARPTAELCIDCKHLEEQKERSGLV